MPRPTGKHKPPRTKAQKAAAAETRLAALAVKGRWPVPQAKRADVVKTVLGLALDARAPATDRLRATAVLVGMEDANQRDDHLAVKNARLDAGKATEGIQAVERTYIRLPAPEPPK